MKEQQTPKVKNIIRGCLASVLVVCTILLILGCYFYLKPNIGDLMLATIHDDIAGIDRCIRSGVEINRVEKRGFGGNTIGRTPLSVALQYSNSDTVSHLIRSGADVNFANGFGYTPASYAAMRGDLRIIEILSEAGADFTIVSDRYTPIEWAKLAGHEEAARLIERIIADP